MQNMYQNERSRKKSPSLLSILVIGVVLFFSAVGELSEDIFFLIFALILFLLPVIVFAVLFSKLWKKKSHSDVHTHDRIDHQSDIRINPATGKTSYIPVNHSTQHSAKEHWKQQLDGLLANGTIDRAEYRALMNRKF